MQYLYAGLAILALVGGIGFMVWREAKSAGYNKSFIEQIREAEKQREESKEKIEDVDAMCRNRRARAAAWLRQKMRDQKLHDR